VSHKKLSRSTNARRALLRNLASNLVLHERIITTKAKAKAVKPFVEKLVTAAKNDSQISRRYLLAKLDRENAVRKLLELYGPVFKGRPGGYTRIIRLQPRMGDRAEMVVIEFVEKVSETTARKKLQEKSRKVGSKKEEKKTVKPKVKKNKATKVKATKPSKVSSKKAAAK
jgi:large subunit ribosomal protein L17